MRRTPGDGIDKQSSIETTEHELYVSLIRVASELSNDFHRLFKQRNLSESAYKTLQILRRNRDSGCRAAEIGSQLIVPVPDVTRLVDRLVDRGLATRVKSKYDGRAVTISITAEGLEMLSALEGPVSDLHKSQLRGMSEKSMRSLIDSLSEVRDVHADHIKRLHSNSTASPSR